MPPSDGVPEWRVVVEMGQWFVLDMQFTEFLRQALNGELFLPVIEGDPSFESLGSVEL
ncbi:hypothetical protein [Streptomyces sp. NPDC059787]|uniref:hypothetical protein n=1 Tax=Streptomyces sp. NPDC059787 TaxID=3346947 RepID=UPI00366843E6